MAKSLPIFTVFYRYSKTLSFIQSLPSGAEKTGYQSIKGGYYPDQWRFLSYFVIKCHILSGRFFVRQVKLPFYRLMASSHRLPLQNDNNLPPHMLSSRIKPSGDDQTGPKITEIKIQFLAQRDHHKENQCSQRTILN